MEHLYFYHIVDSNADMSKGLLSLQFMYDNHLYDLFDKNIIKYKYRITNLWNIDKYKNKEYLSREEYIDALNTFRGQYGASYIYFFRYTPYKALGSKISKLSTYKDIYRIDINNPSVKNIINDIFYGYDMSNKSNNKLDKEYYENINEEECFSKYDDNIEMNFSRLNHIGISLKNNYCPIKYLEKVEWR